MEKELKKPSSIDALLGGKGIKEFFLEEDKSLEEQKERLNRTLEIIWQTLSLVLPDNFDGEMTLTVPSSVLVKLGLVSEATIRAIIRREELGAAPVNRIVITRRKNGGFIIKETYVAQEDFIGDIQKSHIVEEITSLTKKPDGIFEVTIKGRSLNPRLQALGESWVPEKPVEGEIKDLEVTSRRLNTTLALLVEGLIPGYIN